MKIKTAIGIGVFLYAQAAISGPTASITPAGNGARIKAAEYSVAQRALARELAPVKALADFHMLLQQPTQGIGAFRRLKAADQAIFLASLTFNEKGLSGFNYRVIEDSLTVREAHELLTLFGVQHVVRQLKGLRVSSQADLLIRKTEINPFGEGLEENEKDYENYYCQARATCSPRGNDICLSSC